MTDPGVLAVFGPTASGKSAVAEAIADRIPATLISADAMQVYRGLPILTNQSERDTELVAIWDLDHEASVGEYAELAHAAVDRALERGTTPIVVGGTGLYLRAALVELDLPPAPEPGMRERWEGEYDRLGAEAAHELLAERDPEAAARVHPNDRRRVVRALELSEAGASLAPSEGRLWSEEMRHPTLVIGLEVPKDVLEERIERRTRQMFESGVESRGSARARAPDLLHGAHRARPPRHRRAPSGRGNRHTDPPHEPVRGLPAQVDATHTRPCYRASRPPGGRGGR